jgi:hypothetical protein
MFYEPSGGGLQPTTEDQHRVDEIVSRGPAGALAVAGVAVLLVLAIWFAFYLFVFVPRA